MKITFDPTIYKKSGSKIEFFGFDKIPDKIRDKISEQSTLR